MRNRFLNNYNSKTQRAFDYLDKNKFKSFINNSTNPNFLAMNKINSLKSDIRNKYRNNPKKTFKKSKFLSKDKPKKLSLKKNLHINTNIIDNRHFIRQFEELFEQTTNNNIVNYFNGRKVEKMDDLVKRIKEFNYNDFMKKLRRKKSKNKKEYNNYKPRNLSAQPYNYKGCSYYTQPFKTCQNENNCSEIYLSTTSAATSRNLGEENLINLGQSLNSLKYSINSYTTFNPLKKELSYNFEKIGNKRLGRNQNPSQYINEVERIKLFQDRIKFRNFSYNSYLNKNNIDNLIYHYKTQKSLNKNFI